jgi:hypothetical protein
MEQFRQHISLALYVTLFLCLSPNASAISNIQTTIPTQLQGSYSLNGISCEETHDLSLSFGEWIGVNVSGNKIWQVAEYTCAVRQYSKTSQHSGIADVECYDNVGEPIGVESLQLIKSGITFSRSIALRCNPETIRVPISQEPK